MNELDLLISEQGKEPEIITNESSNETTEMVLILEKIEHNTQHLNNQFYLFSVLVFTILIVTMFYKTLKSFY